MADLSNELDLNVPAAPSLTLDAAPAAPTLTLDPAGVGVGVSSRGVASSII